MHSGSRSGRSGAGVTVAAIGERGADSNVPAPLFTIPPWLISLVPELVRQFKTMSLHRGERAAVKRDTRKPHSAGVHPHTATLPHRSKVRVDPLGSAVAAQAAMNHRDTLEPSVDGGLGGRGGGGGGEGGLGDGCGGDGGLGGRVWAGGGDVEL